MNITFKLDPFPFKLKVTTSDDIGECLDGATLAWSKGAEMQLRHQLLPDMLAVLAHETVHVIVLLEKWIDGELDEETKAYLTQFIVKKVVAKLLAAEKIE